MYDMKLKERYTRNAIEENADRGSIYRSWHMVQYCTSGFRIGSTEYQLVSKDFCVTVSIAKTKHMVTRRKDTEGDSLPISVNEGKIKGVQVFLCLASNVGASALRKPDFMDKNLRICTKRNIFEGCVVSVLLYGSKCWISLCRQKLEAELLPS